MKFILSILFVFLLAVPSASAQHRKKNASRQFDFELRGGINLCQIDGDASANYSKIGFHGSVGTSFPVSDDDLWRFVVEIGVSQKGSRIENSSLDRHISLLYVEVPLMIARDMLNESKLRLAAGVAPAILATANVTTDGAYDNLQSDNYKRMDRLPICLSARYRFSQNIGADLRFYNSMLNIAIENGSGTYRIFRSNKGQFSRLIQAGITLNF